MIQEIVKNYIHGYCVKTGFGQQHFAIARAHAGNRFQQGDQFHPGEATPVRIGQRQLSEQGIHPVTIQQALPFPMLYVGQ